MGYIEEKQDLEQREARLAIDRMRVERAVLVERIGSLEQEAEALRDMISRLSQGGRGAVL